MKTVTKAFLRYPLRRRSLSFVQLMGIACGVAAVVGMTLSARAALSSFSQAVEFLRGKTTHSLERPAGPMDETLISRLIADPAVTRCSPVIDRRLRLAHGEIVRFLGIDPFLDRELRPELARVNTGKTGEETGRGLLTFLLDDRAAVMDEQLARQLTLAVGDTFETARGPLKLVGTFPNPTGEPIILMDIAHAQRFFRLTGVIDRVDLILRNEQEFRSRWDQGFRILSNQQRAETFGAMLNAFRLNLEALSLMALFVGVFLIYNTAMFAIVSRRRDAGILRSLGAKRHEIVGAFLTEILLLGIVGGALGAVMGYFLSRFLTGLVGGTISSLYFFLRPTPVPWSSLILLAGVLLGCGASLFGSLFPLAELVRTDPVQSIRGRGMRRETAHLSGWVALAGIAIVIASGVLVLLAHRNVYFGFAGTFTFLIGVSLCTGAVLVLLSPVLRWLFASISGVTGKVASGNIRQNLGRTAVATAAFMVALSMSIGLGSMIGSFRESVVWWMGTQLQAEVYVGITNEIEVPEDFYLELKSVPGVGGLDPYRNVQIVYQGKSIYLTAVDAGVLKRYTRFGWLSGGNEHWDAVKQGEVIVSESFARRFKKKPGDRITLDAFKGPASLRVAAAYYDYTSEHGVIMMDRDTYISLFGDRSINTVGVFIDPGNPRRAEIVEEVRRRAQTRGLPVRSRQQLKDAILDVFDATFAVTRSMRALAIIVAFFGITGALLTLYMERRRDFGIYRALGFSTRQVAAMTMLEGVGIGLVSFILSIVVGTVLALLLIKVINLQSFNWTIFFYPSWTSYLIGLATAVLASVAAALYPVWKVWRTYPQMQIREE